jgi:dTDP-L-rhamnose 4-epimerase
MKVFITGGAGLIGQAIARRHIAHGDEVFVYDNRYNEFNDYSNIQGEDLYANGYTLEDALRYVNPDVISHQAACVGVGESQYKIRLYHNNNVSFTARLLQYILDLKLKPEKIMLAGSMEPYGEGQRKCVNCEEIFIPMKPRDRIDIRCPDCFSDTLPLPMWEPQPLSPQSQYAVSKMTQESMLRVFCNTYDIPGVSLRYFSVYGTECNHRNPYTGVLSIIANKLINSDEVELSEDGEQTRDLIHADDIGLAHFTGVNCDTGTFISLNIGTGKSVSLKYVAEAIKDKLKIDKPIVYNGKLRRGDIKDACASTFGASAVLGWKSSIRIEDGIDAYCRYVADNKDLYTTGDICWEADKAPERSGLI